WSRRRRTPARHRLSSPLTRSTMLAAVEGEVLAVLAWGCGRLRARGCAPPSTAAALAAMPAPAAPRW
ncbi:MAG: hypothetical protein ACRC67_17555, partial [Inquilinus sp.]|uniref:hypothetical protein n=1 Tax=Inquilinus sp. TaxID=1932117 RepID=UPI003F33F1BD